MNEITHVFLCLIKKKKTIKTLLFHPKIRKIVRVFRIPVNEVGCLCAKDVLV